MVFQLSRRKVPDVRQLPPQVTNRCPCWHGPGRRGRRIRLPPGRHVRHQKGRRLRGSGKGRHFPCRPGRGGPIAGARRIGRRGERSRSAGPAAAMVKWGRQDRAGGRGRMRRAQRGRPHRSRSHGARNVPDGFGLPAPQPAACPGPWSQTL